MLLEILELFMINFHKLVLTAPQYSENTSEYTDFTNPGSFLSKTYLSPINVFGIKLYLKQIIFDYQRCLNVKMTLTNISPMSHFYTPWKRQKTVGFLTFSASIDMWHWTKMGWCQYARMTMPQKIINNVSFNFISNNVKGLQISKNVYNYWNTLKIKYLPIV